MSRKRILALTLTVAVLALLAAPVRRSAARTGLNSSVFCDSQGHQVLECFAEAFGGTGSYTYQWNPTPFGTGNDGSYALVHCGPVGTNETVSVTVTDSSGATSSSYYVAFCGDAQ